MKAKQVQRILLICGLVGIASLIFWMGFHEHSKPAAAGSLPHPQAVFVPLKPPVPSVISVAARRKDDRNPLLQTLLNCCRDTASVLKRGPQPANRRRRTQAV